MNSKSIFWLVTYIYYIYDNSNVELSKKLVYILLNGNSISISKILIDIPVNNLLFKNNFPLLSAFKVYSQIYYFRIKRKITVYLYRRYMRKLCNTTLLKKVEECHSQKDLQL